jgi:hypothetical protein
VSPRASYMNYRMRSDWTQSTMLSPYRAFRGWYVGNISKSAQTSQSAGLGLLNRSCASARIEVIDAAPSC